MPVTVAKKKAFRNAETGETGENNENDKNIDKDENSGTNLTIVSYI